MSSLELTNVLAAFGTLAVQIGTVLLVGLYLFRRSSPALRDIAALVERYALITALALSVAASAATLYYSAGLGLEPCPLCWWQRVFLYPQVILLTLAFWKRDHDISLYAMVLSIAGLGVALYHHALQMLPGSGLPCPATGVSCAQRLVFEFGYITFPLMAVSIFAMLIALMLFARRK